MRPTTFRSAVWCIALFRWQPTFAVRAIMTGSTAKVGAVVRAVGIVSIALVSEAPSVRRASTAISGTFGTRASFSGRTISFGPALTTSRRTGKATGVTWAWFVSVLISETPIWTTSFKIRTAIRVAAIKFGELSWGSHPLRASSEPWMWRAGSAPEITVKFSATGPVTPPPVPVPFASKGLKLPRTASRVTIPAAESRRMPPVRTFRRPEVRSAVTISKLVE